MTRSAIATWQGSGLSGSGRLSTESASLNNIPFDFKERFAIKVTETNPEELLAAAHASCFVMKLSFVLFEKGFDAESLSAKANLNLENGVILGSHISLDASITGISLQLFNTCVKEAFENCPVSKAFAFTTTCEAHLSTGV